MEEDIKILEEYIQEELEIFNRDKLEDTDGFHISYKEIRAIENIIARNKELEQKNRTRIIGKYGDVKLDDLLKDNYIPKSKVIEKIEKLKTKTIPIKTKDKTIDFCYEMFTIKALQELLES